MSDDPLLRLRASHLVALWVLDRLRSALVLASPRVPVVNEIRFGGHTPRPHRHAWAETLEAKTEEGMAFTVRCTICGVHDIGQVKRGRNNRARGNRIELDIARRLGLRKVGMYGGPEDAGTRDDPFLVQVKSRSGSAFPSWMDTELAKLPVTAQQTPLLVVAEAGVVGKKRRALVVLRLEDWIALHGPVKP